MFLGPLFFKTQLSDSETEKRTIENSLHTSLRKIAEANGFKVKENKIGFGIEVHGKKNNSKIKISETLHNGLDYIQVSIKLPKHKQKYPFSISKETIATYAKKKLGFRDIEIFDTNFDDKILLRAKNPDFLTTLLDNRTRELIMRLNKCDVFHLTNKELNCYISSTSYDKIKDALYTLTSISKSLDGIENLQKKLISSIKQEDHHLVIKKMIHTLITNYSSEDSTKEFLLKLLSDKNILKQIEACAYLPDSISEKHLVKILENEQLNNYKTSRIIDILRNRIQLKNLSVLKRHIDYKDNTTKIAILSYLEDYGDESINHIFINELKSTEFSVVKAAAQGLMKHGIIKNIEEISTIAKSTHIFLKFNVLLQDVIKTIKDRYDHLEHGSLSLAADDTNKGKLSLDKEKGLLSLEDN